MKQAFRFVITAIAILAMYLLLVAAIQDNIIGDWKYIFVPFAVMTICKLNSIISDMENS